MAKFEVRKVDDTYHVYGHMNELTEFSAILADGDTPVRINLEAVSSINSVGAKALMLLVRSLGGRELFFLEVPSFLIQMFNVVPSLIGKKAKNVISLFAPYHCKACNTTTETLIRRDEVRMTNRGTYAPTRCCERCQAPMKVRGDEEDLFLFMTYSA